MRFLQQLRLALAKVIVTSGLRARRDAQVLLMAGIIAAQAPVFAAEKADELRMGDTANEKTHAVSGSGRVDSETIKAKVGALEQSYPSRVVQGKNSGIGFEMAIPPPHGGEGKPIILEIEEIHNRRPDVFGYTVEVNGKPVYFRTYQEMGAGPNHYYVQFDRKTAGSGKIKVRLINAGEAPFAIGRVWLYDDFPGLAESEGTYRKMPFCDDPRVLLGAPKYDPAAQPGVSEEQYNEQLWQTLKSKFEGTPYIPGLSSAVLYAFRGATDNRKKIDEELDRAADRNAPSQMGFLGTEWGAHPYSPDGLGGFFGDVKYSSIAYDTDSGKFKTSWPGSPGGVTWPTWNDPQLQKFLEHRMSRAAGYYAQERAFLRAEGKNLPTPLICQEWGLSVPGGGDWNDATVAAAKRDGIEMVPGEKMSPGQKLWIHKNLSEVPSRFAEVFRRAVGRESIWVDRGAVKLPVDQLWDQYFFHTFYPAVQPLYDDQWAGWQTGVGPHVYTTGETGPHVPQAYYDYVIALGKLVTVNLERGFFRDDLDFVQTLYELGFQWVTPCNSRPGDGALFLRSAQEIDARPAEPPLHFDRKLLDVRFLRDEGIGPKGSLVESDNLVISKGARDHGKFLQIADASKPGRVLYRIADGGRPLGENLTLFVGGNVADGDENSIDLAIGTDPHKLVPAGKLTAKEFVTEKYWPWNRTARMDLGSALKGQTSGYLELVFHVKNKNTAVNARIDELQVLAPWPTKSGQLDGEKLSVKERRTQSLLVQDRAVFERLQRDYASQVGEDADWRKASALAAEGRYRSAYRLMVGAMAQALPAKFAVRSHGTLGRYPVTVKLADENNNVLVDVLKADEKGFDLQFTTKEPQTCSVAVERPCSLEPAGPNHFVLKPDPQGKRNFDLEIKPVDPDARVLPRQLSGIYAGGAPGGIFVETQETDLWMDNPIYVPVAANAVRNRVQDGTDIPAGKDARSMDKVELTIDETGQATGIKASCGVETGRIKAFYPPVLTGELCNGIVELESGRRYELGNRLPVFTKFEVEGLKPHYRNNSAEDLVKAILPGLTVEISYCPYTCNNRLPRVISMKALKQEEK